MNKEQIRKLRKKWEKILKKEGLRAIESNKYMIEDRISRVINSYRHGFEDFIGKSNFWDTLQDFYWNYYDEKSKPIELYILGYTNLEISRKLHIKHSKIKHLIKKFRKKFRLYLENRTPKIFRK